MIQKLPPKKIVVGDNAYICYETLLTPFSGVEKEDPAKDAFNFYLSQLRIRMSPHQQERHPSALLDFSTFCFQTNSLKAFLNLGM